MHNFALKMAGDKVTEHYVVFKELFVGLSELIFMKKT